MYDRIRAPMLGAVTCRADPYEIRRRGKRKTNCDLVGPARACESSTHCLRLKLDCLKQSSSRASAKSLIHQKRLMMPHSNAVTYRALLLFRPDIVLLLSRSSWRDPAGAQSGRPILNPENCGRHDRLYIAGWKLARIDAKFACAK